MNNFSLHQIVLALNNANARYLVVGGFAVIAHGNVRSTLNVDLLVPPDNSNFHQVMMALELLGLCRTDFTADPAWQTQPRHKAALSCSGHMDVTILEQNADRFAAALEHVKYEPLFDGTPVPICGYADLVQMKASAGRPKDLLDLEQMEKASGEVRRTYEVDPWDDCTFEGSELANIRRLARLSFAQKLAWVEDAYQVSLAFLACRCRMGLKSVLTNGRIVG